MITFLATAPAMTAPVRTSRMTWKKILRRAFEMAGAPYADGAFAPL